MESNILEQLLSHEDSIRRNAELALTQLRNENPASLSFTLIEGMKNAKPEITQLSSVLYKKLFLDDSRAASMTSEDLEQMKASVMGTMDFTQPLMTLKRKGDILAKIFA
jgi:hypothetical protein